MLGARAPAVRHHGSIALASIYIHVPFCERKCAYCDFYSVEDLQHVGSYLFAVQDEMRHRAAMAQGVRFQTVYFGGGTPSLLSPDDVGIVLDAVRGAFSIDADAEITLEANPGTVSDGTLRAFRELGANRISLGVQSLRDEELAQLGRIHTAAVGREAVQLARSAGFANLGVDLMYGIPSQSVAEWEETVRAALMLRVDHVSAYALTYEGNTPLARTLPVARRASLETEAAMQLSTFRLFAAHGYLRYEVSNFARPGFQCRHNLAYWSHEPYLGFGPSAHSFWHRDGVPRRWANTRDLSAYLQRLQAGRLPIDFEERLTPVDLLREHLLLGLRMGSLDLGHIVANFGYDLRIERKTVLDGLETEGLATVQGRALRLTPAGMLLAEEIARRLLP